MVGWARGWRPCALVTQTADRTSDWYCAWTSVTVYNRTWFVVSRVATHMPIALDGKCLWATAPYILYKTRVFVRRERSRGVAGCSSLCRDAVTGVR